MGIESNDRLASHIDSCCCEILEEQDSLGDLRKPFADVLDMSTMDEQRRDWLDSRSVLNGYREIKRGYRVTFNFWCMRPALVSAFAFYFS
uniref:Uncharacterized protein n=1 Tax=Parascaris equorum TaxID=6256 RepID=A0A914REH9_PAREQ